MRKADIVTGLGFLGFSVGYWFVADALPFSPSFGDPGPAELPKLIAAVCAVASIAIVIIGAKAAPAADGKRMFPSKGVVFLVWSLLAAIALPILHTPATLFLYVFGGIVIQTGVSSWKLAAFCAPVVTGLVYALFKMLLSVPLP